jgi:hypothetical protein
MSIAILTQVYDEMRRLAIAGSAVAGGDFRLKKLIGPLQQAGAKVPVFAKVAQAAKTVVEGKDSAIALLELTTLVNAILYTQGETGAAGPLVALETTDLGVPAIQASARVLKPLLEALTTTGSGRIELIRDAHERGAFRDLRLVRPALDALDDVYGEIADFMAEQVLPLYGKAILPELRAKFDMKGRMGHARRLQLLHALDPSETRDLVKQALDAGSKEVRIVAIACLGAAPEELSYLLEQAVAKAQEVRQAAYRALATMEDEAAVAALKKTMDGKDLDLAADALRRSRSPKLLSLLIDSAEKELAALPKIKDKKDISPKIIRTTTLLNCLTGRDDRTSEAFLLKVFAQRAELNKIESVSRSGSDLNSAVVRIMAQGTKALQTALVDAHASLPAEDLAWCFQAARRALAAERVHEVFAPYLTATLNATKIQPAWAKRESLLDALGQRRHDYGRLEEEAPALDPRWLDLAVQMEHLALVHQLIRPGHAAANAFLTATFSASLQKAKQLHDCHDVVASMVRASHPEATDALVAVLEKLGGKHDYLVYWIGNLIVELPKAALPRLEALIPQLNDKVADSLLGYMQQLREKT